MEEHIEEWDEEVERITRHNVHEPNTYELAEQELRSEERIERLKMEDNQ